MNDLVTIVFGKGASIVGILGAIIAFILSWQTIKTNKYKAVHDFLSIMENKEMVRARRYVYNYNPGNNIKLDEEEINIVINFFQHWGLLAKEKYLPMWVFDTASGSGVVRLYDRAKPYIEEVRKYHDDKTYADKFEWLYNEVKKRKGISNTRPSVPIHQDEISMPRRRSRRAFRLGSKRPSRKGRNKAPRVNSQAYLS